MHHTMMRGFQDRCCSCCFWYFLLILLLVQRRPITMQDNRTEHSELIETVDQDHVLTRPVLLACLSVCWSASTESISWTVKRGRKKRATSGAKVQSDLQCHFSKLQAVEYFFREHHLLLTIVSSPVSTEPN